MHLFYTKQILKGRKWVFPLLLIFVSFHCSTSNKKSLPVSQLKVNANTRNDSWGFIGIGGGGAMFHPVISPFNADLVVLNCDMGGGYITHNGGSNWRMFNLRGQISFFAFDPLDSTVIYANSIGLFRSANQGATWSLVYPQPSLVKGIVSRGDHAEEEIITVDSSQRKVLAFAIDPGQSNTWYAAISINGSMGLYTTADEGLHWQKQTALIDSAENIFINPSSPVNDRSIIVASGNTIISRKNGKWILNAVPAAVNKITTYTGGFDSGQGKYIIYAIAGKSYFDRQGKEQGIYFTDNEGASWQNRQKGLLKLGLQNGKLPEWRTIATAASKPNVLYVSYNNLSIAADTQSIGVARSEDFGKTWQLVWQDKLSKKTGIPAPNFSHDWLNERFGPSWGENPFSIGVAPGNPDICYGTDFGRAVKTIDGGKTWQQVYSTQIENKGWKSNGLEVTTSYSVVFNPFEPANLFITNTDIGLMESKDGGISWMSATNNNGIPNKWQNSTYWLAFDTAVKGRAWAVMSDIHDLPRPKMWRNGFEHFNGGIVQTEDAGESWKVISNDIGEAAFTHVLIDYSSSPNARTLYACAFGKGVYKSDDGGRTWKKKNNGIEIEKPFAWRIFQREKDGVLFLIVNRKSENGKIGDADDGALYRSSDRAETWEKINLPQYTNGPTSIIDDPLNDGWLLLSAWGRSTPGKFSADIGGGIFLSKDDGKTWAPVLSADQHIHDITFDKRNNTFYAGGFESAAYASKDNGITWKRIKGFNFKWGKRVEPDPRNPDMIFIITFGGGVWYGPAKGDGQAVEDITDPPSILFN